MTKLNEQDKPEARTAVAGRLHTFVMRIIDFLHKKLFFSHWAGKQIQRIGEDRLVKYLESQGFREHTLNDGAKRYYDPKDPSKHWTFKDIGISA